MVQGGGIRVRIRMQKDGCVAHQSFAARRTKSGGEREVGGRALRTVIAEEESGAMGEA